MKTHFLKHSKFLLLVTFLWLLLSFNLSSCSTNFGDPDYKYRIPEQTSDGWETDSLSSVGMSQDLIVEMINEIQRETYENINSILIIKDGKLVLEEYFNSYNRDLKHRCYSVTKTISSLLIGIAIEKKLIKGVNENITTFFPEYEDIDWSSGKSDIKLHHILSMTTGLDWSEVGIPYSSSRNTHSQMYDSDDWARFVLERPMKFMPGERFNYNTGTSNMLAHIIKNSTGWQADDFTEENLFKPLGISGFDWFKDPNGYPSTGGTQGGISLRPRDMAKIGYLILNNGRWKDSQILPASWIEETTKIHTNYGTAGYGYQLWSYSSKDTKGRKFEFFSAQGYGGQFIFVLPAQNMVVVSTAFNPDDQKKWFQSFDMLQKFILPSVK